MNPVMRARALIAAIATMLLLVGVAGAAVPLVRISTDPYTGGGSQHATEVEPDTFAAGSTIVSVFQVGRFFDGGSSNIGFSTSKDAGVNWSPGFLPGITKVAGGPYDRVSDPSVAYDQRNNVWIISSLPLSGSTAAGVLASRSTDGVTWGNPVTITTAGRPDKNWTACDNTPSSPFYGHCYTQWDDNGSGNLIKMSTSTDGGLTWGPALNTADSAAGIAGQPLIKKNGQVIVPIDDAFEGSIRYFTSGNGGASWNATKFVATISDHGVAGSMRAPPLPSAEIDKTNRVYIVWQDCRFRTSCSANDIVMATIKLGVSAVVRIPIDPVSSGIDHFIPGLAVDRSTGRSSAHLGLTYYYYPVSNCGSTCELHVGFISSTDSGTTWSSPIELAGPIRPTWIANTSQGRMVGDYISGSYSGGTVHSVFAVATAPVGSVFDEAMYTTATGLFGTGVAQAGGDFVVTTTSDHPPLTVPATSH
jgi:hypothetical protein